MGNRTRLLALILGLLCLPAAMAESSPPQPTISYDGQHYSGDSMPAALRQKLYELDIENNQQKRQAIDQYILNRYLQEKAQQENRSLREVQQQLLATEAPTEERVQQFYEANKSRIQAPLEQIRDKLVQFLRTQQLAVKQAQLMATIGQEKGYRLRLPEPQAPLFDIAIEGYPSKGNPEAKVTLVEFADYQCPHCKTASKAVKKLLERYGDQLQVVYRDFPINPSGISRKVAEAAVCADQQGQFWPFHDLAFERQSYLKAIKPDMLAQQLGLDMDKFNSCFALPETKARVTASLEEGQRLGISGTPTFFINGRQLHVHGELEPELIKAVEGAISTL